MNRRAAGPVIIGMVAVLALVLAGRTAAAPEPSSASLRAATAALAQARDLALSHHPDEAAARLRSTRHEVGDDPTLLLTLARLDEDLENYPEAELASRTVLASRPTDTEASLLLAEAYVSQGEVASASAVARSLRGRPGLSADQRGRLNLLRLEIRGLEARKAGLLALVAYGRSVLPSLRKAVALAPRSAQIRYALGRFYLLAPGLMGGDVAKARKELSEACQLDPACFECRAWALAAAVKAGSPVGAAKRRYEQDFGQLPEARRALARALAYRIQP